MAETPAGVTPAPAATPPAVPPITPPVTPEAEKVTVDKAEYEQLKVAAADKARAEARAAAAQSKADKLSSTRGGKNLFGKETPQPTAEQLEAESNEEFRSAVGEITKLAMDPKYREVMDVDLTLRNLIATDPSQVLYLYAKNAIDAADAKEIVETMFKERLVVIQKEKGVQPPPADKKDEDKTTPPGGAPNPSGNQAPQAAMDAAMKITNPDDRRAAMIRAKMGNMTI